MVWMGKPTTVWLGEHEGKRGIVQKLTTRNATILTTTGQEVEVPVVYLDPSPNRL